MSRSRSPPAPIYDKYEKSDKYKYESSGMRDRDRDLKIAHASSGSVQMDDKKDMEVDRQRLSESKRSGTAGVSDLDESRNVRGRDKIKDERDNLLERERPRDKERERTRDRERDRERENNFVERDY